MELSDIPKDRLKEYTKRGFVLANDNDFNRSSELVKYLNSDILEFDLDKITEEQAIKNAYQCLDIYNDYSLINKIKRINYHIPVEYQNWDSFDYRAIISYTNYLFLFKTKLTNRTGELSYYLFPQEHTELAPICISHEFIHALKDTNGNEQRYTFRTGEVLPMLHELIVLEKQPSDFVKKYLNMRLQTLWECASSFNHGYSLQSRNVDEAYLLMCESSKFLNSFYLALVLFNIYKTNPEFMLKEIKKVLHKEATTRELLIKNGFYDIQNSNRLVQQEMDSIRKLIK